MAVYKKRWRFIKLSLHWRTVTCDSHMTDVYTDWPVCVRAKGLSIPDFRSSREKEVTTSVQRAPCERVYTFLLPAVRKKGRRCEEFVNLSQGKKDEIIQDFPPPPPVCRNSCRPGETPPPPPSRLRKVRLETRGLHIGGRGLVTGSVAIEDAARTPQDFTNTASRQTRLLPR